MGTASLWLKVCVSCDRFATAASCGPNYGERLADRVAAALNEDKRQHQIMLRRVPCLSGCKHPGNVAVGATGRTKFRFHNLGLECAQAIVAFATQRLLPNCDEADGDTISLELKGHLAAIMAPH
jgi:predicted metal-binding protein